MVLPDENGQRRVAVAPVESVTCTVNVLVPFIPLGVPDMMPSEDNFSLLGRLPFTKDQIYGPCPDTACNRKAS